MTERLTDEILGQIERTGLCSPREVRSLLSEVRSLRAAPSPQTTPPDADLALFPASMWRARAASLSARVEALEGALRELLDATTPAFVDVMRSAMPDAEIGRLFKVRLAARAALAAPAASPDDTHAIDREIADDDRAFGRPTERGDL